MPASLPDDIDFAVCLTHDVDRPYKSYQSLYYALRERSAYHIQTLLSSVRPYWQFEEIMALENELEVRSAFYFLDEPSQLEVRSVRDLLSLKHLTNHLGRYDIESPDISSIIHRLDEGGWEIGLHGSSISYREEEHLRTEKDRLERVLGHSVDGVRQHYLHLDIPRTWQYQSNVGLRYDTSLGSSTEYGFGNGYRPRQPLDDEFVIFPLTLMETALPDPASRFDDAWAVCDQLLTEAAENGATMTILWHPRYFNESEFPGYRRLYRQLVEAALERGAWVGPPGELYERLDWTSERDAQPSKRRQQMNEHGTDRNRQRRY